ncbi:tyrosine-type recombinase/integrase [Sphingomonas sp. LB-2]|uniref:tyrosine-type recombinase/integrase n=1 Tax=Sphingomonas caeni TaxID=2984949 RepID=UPI0022327104|nr:tyrosine-type recombinase/integrase [Sphingomonas caeni]MCW3847893.1 tyrosine-type recombinase/integrase [Sphingomonas caeni]
MADARARITKRLVDALEPGAMDMTIRDSDVLGFGVKITPAGHITYILRYWFEGRQRKYRIGVHGAPWTPEAARAEAQVLLGKVADGIDPQQEKIAERKEQTVAELCDTYLAEALYAAKESSIKQARNNIENHIKPLIGSRRASKIVRADIEQLLRDIAAGKTRSVRKTGYRKLSRVRGGRGAANQAVTTLSAVLGFAVVRGLRLDNPAIGVKKFPGKKMERFLAPVELARLGEALAAAASLGVESVYAIAALRLLILTGCRKNEILKLKRVHIDAYHRCLRLPDSKTGAKVVHLGAPAMRIISGVPQVVGNPYLLPGKKEGTHVTDLQAVWVRIRKTAGLEDVRIHDLRHSFASIGASTGDSMLIIGALLGHRSAKTTERYTHLSDHPLKSAAERISDEIAKHLGEAMTFPAANDTADADPFETFWAMEPESETHPPDPILGAIIRTQWLDTRAAAAMLGFTVGTMQTYRWMGTGPAFRKIGRRVVYAADALVAWRKAQAQPDISAAA